MSSVEDTAKQRLEYWLKETGAEFEEKPARGGSKIVVQPFFPCQPGATFLFNKLGAFMGMEDPQ